MLIWSATASETSGVTGPPSRRTRPRLSRSFVRSIGNSGRRDVRRRTSTAAILSRARGLPPLHPRRHLGGAADLLGDDLELELAGDEAADTDGDRGLGDLQLRDLELARLCLVGGGPAGGDLAAADDDEAGGVEGVSGFRPADGQVAGLGGRRDR